MFPTTGGPYMSLCRSYLSAPQAQSEPTQPMPCSILHVADHGCWCCLAFRVVPKPTNTKVKTVWYGWICYILFADFLQVYPFKAHWPNYSWDIWDIPTKRPCFDCHCDQRLMAAVRNRTKTPVVQASWEVKEAKYRLWCWNMSKKPMNLLLNIDRAKLYPIPIGGTECGLIVPWHGAVHLKMLSTTTTVSVQETEVSSTWGICSWWPT